MYFVSLLISHLSENHTRLIVALKILVRGWLLVAFDIPQHIVSDIHSIIEATFVLKASITMLPGSVCCAQGTSDASLQMFSCYHWPATQSDHKPCS